MWFTAKSSGMLEMKNFTSANMKGRTYVRTDGRADDYVTTKISWMHRWPVIVNYNYFTLYKASSLTLKIIWPKRVSFFVFLRCRIFILRSHRSRLSSIVRSDSICFYWNGWMKIDRSFWYTNQVQWHTNHVKENQSKINHYSWFLSRKTSRLIKWIYKARYELLLLKRKQQLNNSLETTKLKLMSC